MTSHYLEVPDESQGRYALGEDISHHFVRAQRHEFEQAIQYEFRYIVISNVNMMGEISVHRVFAHCKSEFAFVKKRGFSLTKSKIGYRFT